jgi:hypothetical protein
MVQLIKVAVDNFSMYKPPPGLAPVAALEDMVVLYIVTVDTCVMYTPVATPAEFSVMVHSLMWLVEPEIVIPPFVPYANPPVMMSPM